MRCICEEQKGESVKMIMSTFYFIFNAAESKLEMEIVRVMDLCYRKLSSLAIRSCLPQGLTHKS